MRVIIITLFLFTVRAVAENADTAKAIAETYESSAFKKFLTRCSSHAAETCSESEALHQDVSEKNGAYGLGLCLFDSMNKCLVDYGGSLEEATPTKNQDLSYNPQLAKKTLNGLPNPFLPKELNKQPIIRVPPTKDKPSKDKPSKDKPSKDEPRSLGLIQVETLKFQAVLRTCSHVSARTCFTNPNVDASLLSACLVPSMNQCVYPGETLGAGAPPIRK